MLTNHSSNKCPIMEAKTTTYSGSHKKCSTWKPMKVLVELKLMPLLMLRKKYKFDWCNKGWRKVKDVVAKHGKKFSQFSKPKLPVYSGPLMDGPLCVFVLQCTILMHIFCISPWKFMFFSYCTFFMLHSFHVALFSYCTISMLHFFV